MSDLGAMACSSNWNSKIQSSNLKLLRLDQKLGNRKFDLDNGYSRFFKIWKPIMSNGTYHFRERSLELEFAK